MNGSDKVGISNVSESNSLLLLLDLSKKHSFFNYIPHYSVSFLFFSGGFSSFCQIILQKGQNNFNCKYISVEEGFSK